MFVTGSSLVLVAKALQQNVVETPQRSVRTMRPMMSDQSGIAALAGAQRSISKLMALTLPTHAKALTAVLGVPNRCRG